LEDIPINDQSRLALLQGLAAAQLADTVAADIRQEIPTVTITNQAVVAGKQSARIWDNPVAACPTADDAANTVKHLACWRLNTPGVTYFKH
jgi:hypothetical protein